MRGHFISRIAAIRVKAEPESFILSGCNLFLPSLMALCGMASSLVVCLVEGTANIKEELEETKNWLANIIMDQFLRFSRKQEEIHDWLADMIMQKVDIGVVCAVGEVTEEISKVAITEKGEPMEEESVTDIMEVDVDVNNTDREKDVIATRRLVESLKNTWKSAIAEEKKY